MMMHQARKGSCDNGDVRPWSDLNHNLLYVIIMQLGVVDYLSFRGVCKSWRQFANSNINKFMASKPPMKLHVVWRAFNKPCYLQDFEGRKFKTILPHYPGGVCVGLTCGYLIFFNRTSREFWLVNPITRRELHFPDFPLDYNYPMELEVKAILVFSRAINGWVLLVIKKDSSKIWFSVSGEGDWDDALFDDLTFKDLCAFKGKIYTLNFNHDARLCEVYELKLNAEPELIQVKTKNPLKHYQFHPELELVSSGENIYVMSRVPFSENPNEEDRYRFQELDFGEMKWVVREKTIGESSSFLSSFKHGVPTTSIYSRSCGHGLLVGHNVGDLLKLVNVERAYSFVTNMWYFPHECLKVHFIDEWLAFL